MALGLELVTNGNFDGSANGWTLNGASYGDHNILVNDAISSNTIFLQQTGIGLQANQYYLVTVELTGVAGRLKISLGSSLPNSTVKYQCTRARTIQTVIYQPASSTDIIKLVADDGSFSGVIINSVSVKQVTLSDLILGPELITNGSFNGDASGWNLTNTTWAYSNHNIVHTPSGANKLNPALNNYVIPDDESMYLFEADITGTPGPLNDSVDYEVGNGFGVQPGNDNITTIGSNLRATVQALFGTVSGAFANFRFYPNGTFDGAMTNVSVRRIVGVIGYLPFYSPSIITSVKKIGQDLPFPNYVIAGQGNGSLYKLFKKSTTQNFTVWRSPVYQIGQNFDILEIKIPIYPDMTSNMSIIPILYFDNEETSSVGNTIDSTNYSNSERLIKLTSKSFSNSIRGEANFFLELQFTGSALAVAELPIEINLGVEE